MRIPLAFALASLLASGCASSEEPAPSGGWGGITEEQAAPPPPLKGALSVPTPSVRPYPEREFTREEQEFFDRALKSFRAGEATWPEYKARWRAMGPEATGVLAENLYLAMVASRARSAPHLVEEAKKDLVLMGEGAVPVLVGGLAIRAYRNPEGQEVRVGQEVLHDAAEALSLIGAPSVPGLLDIAGCGERNLVVEASWALGNIGDPRAEEALLALSGDEDWAVRASAVLALRNYPTATARLRMVEALEDPETLVVERAAQALVTGRHAEVLPAVVDVMERGLGKDGVLTVRACLFTLRRLSGQALEADPAAWRRWLEAPR